MTSDHVIPQAVVIHPDRLNRQQEKRDRQAQLEELVALSEAIGIAVAHQDVISVRNPSPGYLFGKGTVEQIAALVKQEGLDVAVINGQLSPIQQRNLERRWQTKVIDRTGLILEIFAARARTAEGRLQVALAQLSYQRTRLVRSWAHLERQRGGLSTVGGPGESQLEIDRRLIDERIVRLKRDLERVSKTRGLHRKNRRQVPYPVVALVGYTNAGKSTLFNALTQADVLAKDQLFATLDPTIRSVHLPSGQKVVLSDTVGFLADLPTELIAAFRATLEEVLEADLILHVRDAAHTDSEAQKNDVLSVLSGLGIDLSDDDVMLDVMNKVDLLADEERQKLDNLVQRAPQMACISAKTGEGIPALLELIDTRLSREHLCHEFVVRASNGALLASLYRVGQVRHRVDSQDYVRLQVSLPAAALGRLQKQFGADGLTVSHENAPTG